MSWRTIVISSRCKLSYKNSYMIIRNEDIQMIHLSEINTLILSTTQVSITAILICELMNKKINIVFCDEKHNHKAQVISYYGGYNTSKKIVQQIQWKKDIKEQVWQKIIKQKIMNQSIILEMFEKNNVDKLQSYIHYVELGDKTNREAYSAKVYFNSLFGNKFTRDLATDINFALDYGYTILLSAINREIVSCGNITQIGIKHKNEFNEFNLSCDIMEAFRPIIDKIVYQNREFEFNQSSKYKLVNLLNEKISIDNKNYYLTNAITLYTTSIFKALETGDINKIIEIEVIRNEL